MADRARHPAVVPLVLLAGRSRRMGEPKQHVRIGPRTFLEHILATLAAQPALPPPVAVGAPGDARAAALIAAAGGCWLTNPRPDDGPLSSIRIALPHLPPDAGLLLWPIDAPLVAPATVARLLAVVAAAPDRLVVPSDGRRRGHPAFFPAWSRADLLAAPLTAGARQVLQSHPDRITHVVVDDPWIAANLNDPAALAAAAASLPAADPARG